MVQITVDIRLLYCNTLPHTATHCTTLQHAAMHCNNPLTFCQGITQHVANGADHRSFFMCFTATHRHTLHTLLHTATH